ncbi:acyl-CoA dehydrogenase N-terminal domain-containing protein, partial [Psychrobacter sp. 1U2]
MLTYKAPLRDIKFLINDVFDFQTHYKDLDNGANA